jgi:2-amino-4-hydroxy-6-hydroxymethyldihydropteridine diphosphokinase
MAEALVALGGNVGDVRATFERAIDILCGDAAVRLVRRSSDYRTPPWGKLDQPPFINAALLVKTTLSPHDLLARAREVESMLGRDRSHETRWGPRTIDIDLIAYDDIVMDDEELRLPHPRWSERAFVLVPLAEIVPDRVISGVGVREALGRLDAAEIVRLPLRQ